MRNFKNLKIWQQGFQIALNIFKITDSLPRSEQWGIGVQMKKAGVSIPSNVAEGSSRSSTKEYNHYIEIALGSSFELETQLLILKTRPIGKEELINETLRLLEEEEKMLTAFSHTLIRK